MAVNKLEVVPWTVAANELTHIRHRVFVVEQNVPVELEIDGLDPSSTHVLVRAQTGVAIGTARLLPDGHIGRVAVLGPWRGQGLGQAMMQTLIEFARDRGDAHVLLNAQASALGFYRRLGFKPQGVEFMEAGIPHQCMCMTLQTADPG